MTLEQRIRNLKPGESVNLSSYESAAGRLLAERSGDGKTFRLVRETENGFVVVSQEGW